MVAGNPTTNAYAESPVYFRAECVCGLWQIVSDADGNAVCVCQSEMEAKRLVNFLNSDWRLAPDLRPTASR
jgi:hypothetical protein